MRTALAWKKNWAETRQHFVDWWQRRSLVFSPTIFPLDPPHAAIPAPDGLGKDNWAYGTEEYCANPELRAQSTVHWLARHEYVGDALPIAGFELGPGALSVFLGAHPVFLPGTIWYDPCWTEEDPSGYAPLRFDPGHRWWRATETTARLLAEAGRDKFMTGCLDLIENLDTLAALRGSNQLLLDMVDRPEWVDEQMADINRLWFEVFERIYDIIKMPDGSSAFHAFSIWGPGKTAKLQCDASAMISPEMFDRFVTPYIQEQCEWLDHSIFHLDGSQCLCHLDSLLGIEALDAIEWTPDPSVPSGGNKHWYDLYRRILNAGKSVQVVGTQVTEVLPLLDAVGGPGLYINGVWGWKTRDEIEDLLEKVKAYR